MGEGLFWLLRPAISAKDAKQDESSDEEHKKENDQAEDQRKPALLFRRRRRPSGGRLPRSAVWILRGRAVHLVLCAAIRAKLGIIRDLLAAF